MRILVWLIRAFIFFSLFAFSLNNLHSAQVHWFFGQAWSAPMVIIVLVAFGSGAILGILAMMPSWWQHRRQAQRALTPASDSPTPSPSPNIPDGI